MLEIIIWATIFSVSGAATTVLLGDRNLLSGNLLNFQKLFSIVFGWRFITAFFLSFIARYSFMIVNSYLLKVPDLAERSTTITTFITLIGIIFIVAANHFFLQEKLNLQQGLGASLILVGVWIILK